MILLTGITGNIGGATARALLEKGVKFRALVRDAAKAQSWADQGVQIVTGDLADAEAVGKYRWLPAIADAVNNSFPKPKTPDEPKMEYILGTQLNLALVEAVGAKGNTSGIAKKYLDKAASEISDDVLSALFAWASGTSMRWLCFFSS